MRPMREWINRVSHAMPSPKRERERGFTLLELAIVVGIIAVLIGGIAATSTLIRSASLQNVGKELADLQSSVNQYQELYGSLPGDTPEASSLFNCGACDGNGNGKLDEEEAGLFFEHLSRAKLLKSDLRASNQGAGFLVPKSDARGGAVVTIESRAPDRIVAVVRMDSQGNGAGALNPLDAQAIDRRIDDGDPSSGRLVVEPASQNASGTSTLATTACKTGVQYNVTNSREQCNLAFVLVGKAFSNAIDKNTEHQWVVTKGAGVFGTWVPDPSWGECSQSCGGGVQTRNLTCVPAAGGPVTVTVNVNCVNIITGATVAQTSCAAMPKPSTTRKFSGCTGTPPATQQLCNAGVCPNSWVPKGWGACRSKDGTAITSGVWEAGSWGNCSANCGTGVEKRKIFCRPQKGVRTQVVECPSVIAGTADCDGPRPDDTEECSVNTCTGTAPEESRACNAHSCASGWQVTPWEDCSPAPQWNISDWSNICTIAYTSTVVNCGGPAVRTRTVQCNAGGVQKRGVSCPSGSCVGAKPDEQKPCSYSCQGEPPPDVAVCYGGSRWGDVYNSGTQLFRHTDDEVEGWVGCLSE